jgi:hypothetical protein
MRTKDNILEENIELRLRNDLLIGYASITISLSQIPFDANYEMPKKTYLLSQLEDVNR